MKLYCKHDASNTSGKLGTAMVHGVYFSLKWFCKSEEIFDYKIIYSQITGLSSKKENRNQHEMKRKLEQDLIVMGQG